MNSRLHKLCRRQPLCQINAARVHIFPSSYYIRYKWYLSIYRWQCWISHIGEETIVSGSAIEGTSSRLFLLSDWLASLRDFSVEWTPSKIDLQKAISHLSCTIPRSSIGSPTKFWSNAKFRPPMSNVIESCILSLESKSNFWIVVDGMSCRSA